MHNSNRTRKKIASISLSVVAALACAAPDVASAQQAPTSQFDTSFPAITEEAPEIVNPMRGLYTQYDKNMAPTPRVPLVSYKRFLWSDIETSPNHYDFSLIDAEIKLAASTGGKFAFRMMGCTVPGNAKLSNIDVPSDFPSILKKGYFINMADPSGGQGWKVYVPDYNDPIYIQRARALIEALAARYDGDPRVAYVEAGFIGTWGEGNYSQMPKTTPSGAIPPTFRMATEMVTCFCKSFKRTLVVVPTDIFKLQPVQPDEAKYAGSYHNALEYALINHKKVGMFRNSLGDLPTTTWFGAPFSDPYVAAAGGVTRWQTAPFTGEWFRAPGPTGSSLPLGLSQVLQYHVSLVANGALGPVQLVGQQLQQLQACGKAAGYRFQLDRVAGEIVPKTRLLNLTAYWENVGVAPIYEPWVTVYQLRSHETNKVVWQGASRLDLRRVLPTSGNQYPVHEAMQIPATVPCGSYQLVLVVEDPAQYYKAPLALASSGAQSDGSYPIGVVSIK